MAELLYCSLGGAIGIESALGDALRRVHADPGKSESAPLNLAINVRDAMPEGGPPRIETANVAPSLNEKLGQDGFVMLAGSDTGSGMAQGIVDQVCEPLLHYEGSGQG
jgi:hypothetical protein